MNLLIWRRLVALLLLGAALGWVSKPVRAEKAPTKAVPSALAGTSVEAGTKRDAKGAARLPSSVRFLDAPTTEKPAARERRLKRECKGRANAGVCLGYAR